MVSYQLTKVRCPSGVCDQRALIRVPSVGVTAGRPPPAVASAGPPPAMASAGPPSGTPVANGDAPLPQPTQIEKANTSGPPQPPILPMCRMVDRCRRDVNHHDLGPSRRRAHPDFTVRDMAQGRGFSLNAVRMRRDEHRGAEERRAGPE